jgi:putative oxidoreductase
MNRVLGPSVGGRPAVILLIIRIVFGFALILHGLPKIEHPFGWMGPQAPVPGFLQCLAAISEFGGGFAIVLGLLTPLACSGVICNMLFAIFLVHMRMGQPFVDPAGGPSYELAAHYLVVALALIIVGPGRWSFDARLFGRSKKDSIS